jgi:small subunit ribosomal protein S2
MSSLTRSTLARRLIHTTRAAQNLPLTQQPEPQPIPVSDAVAATSGSPTGVSGELTSQPAAGPAGRRLTLAEEQSAREVDEWKVNLRKVREWRRNQGKTRESHSVRSPVPLTLTTLLPLAGAAFSHIQPPSYTSRPKSTPTSLLSTLLASGAQLGHSTARLASPFTPYIYGHRAGLHIIDVESATVPLLNKAAKVVKDVVKADGVVLFVGTRAEHRKVVRKAVERLEGNGFGVAGTSWMAGTLTNSVS